MKSNTTKKVTLALGVASVAASLGGVAAKAGPALQTLNNLTNSAEFTVNNTYGQSFSVDGIINNATITPFSTATASLANFTAASATLTTNFVGGSFGGFTPVTAVSAQVEVPLGAPPLTLSTAVASISLNGGTTTQTIGASISSTLFGPSTVSASSSYTNQLINDLSAF